MWGIEKQTQKQWSDGSLKSGCEGIENVAARQLETEKERKSSKNIQSKICCKTYKGQATILYMACLAEKWVHPIEHS